MLQWFASSDSTWRSSTTPLSSRRANPESPQHRTRVLAGPLPYAGRFLAGCGANWSGFPKNVPDCESGAGSSRFVLDLEDRLVGPALRVGHELFDPVRRREGAPNRRARSTSSAVGHFAISASSMPNSSTAWVMRVIKFAQRTILRVVLHGNEPSSARREFRKRRSHAASRVREASSSTLRCRPTRS